MTSPGPLDDLLIVDLSRVLAGPYATMVLAAVKLSGYADPPTRAKAPALEEHRVAILQELGL